MKKRGTFGPDTSMIPVIRTPQRAQYLVHIMFALKAAKFFNTHVVRVHRIRKRYFIVALTYLPIA